MTDADARVAVYIDFDNIVISRYDQVNGRSTYHRDKPRPGAEPDDAFLERLDRAEVDLGAILDFASSFGTLVLTRAYADWSSEVNARYREQLVGRAIDLVQLFPAAAYGKNGADIRLAVDAVEDLFRLPDLTHVVIVAGDSDYIALAQRCKRLGRYVVAIGVAGSTSRSLAAACDELATYDDLPGVPDLPPLPEPEPAPKKKRGAAAAQDATPAEPAETAEPAATAPAHPEDQHDPAEATEPKRGRRARRPAAAPDDAVPDPADAQANAARLLERALRLGHEKEDADWLHNSAVKAQIRRMDSSFSEKALGFRSFSDFLRAHGDLVDLDESSTARMVRLKAGL